MSRFNRSAQLVFTGTALLFTAQVVHLLIPHPVEAQSTPCSGRSVEAQGPEEACGGETHCSQNCTEWFVPGGAFINRCVNPDPPIRTANCVTTDKTSHCGNGGPCVPKVGGGCQDGAGSEKSAQICDNGGPCFVPG